MIEKLKRFINGETIQVEGRKQPLPKYVIRDREEKEAVYYCSGCQERPADDLPDSKVVVPYYCDSCRNLSLREYMSGSVPRKPIIR